MPQKMLVGDKDTVLLIPAFEINGVPQMANFAAANAVPLDTPTSALLNAWIPVRLPSDAGAHWGGNVTCATVDDMKLEMKDSTTKNIKTLCSVGQSQELTYYNYDAVMNFLRDADPTDVASEFNLPLALVSAPDVAYVVAHRIGYTRTAAAATGQEWHFFYVWTDHSIPASADGDYLAVGQTFVPKGVIHFKAILGS